MLNSPNAGLMILLERLAANIDDVRNSRYSYVIKNEAAL